MWHFPDQTISIIPLINIISENRKQSTNQGHVDFQGHCSRKRGLPRGSVVKNPPDNVGEARGSGLAPGSGRPPGGGDGYPLQDSSLEYPMDRGVWQSTVPEVTKSQTWWETEHPWKNIWEFPKDTLICYSVPVCNDIHLLMKCMVPLAGSTCEPREFFF